jgi:hypothetical protein
MVEVVRIRDALLKEAQESVAALRDLFSWERVAGVHLEHYEHIVHRK